MGVIEINDNSISEFIKDNRLIYFQLGIYFIKFQVIENYSKFSITITEKISYESEFEDCNPCVIDIGGNILKNPLIDNKIIKICFYNVEITNNEIISDAFQIKLENGQDIFLDPSFDGINIGNLDVKDLWEENLINNNKYNELIIFINQQQE
jgi:hypothetical protein